jgi:hypothetical protein
VVTFTPQPLYPPGKEPLVPVGYGKLNLPTIVRLMTVAFPSSNVEMFGKLSG